MLHCDKCHENWVPQVPRERVVSDESLPAEAHELSLRVWDLVMSQNEGRREVFLQSKRAAHAKGQGCRPELPAGLVCPLQSVLYTAAFTNIRSCHSSHNLLVLPHILPRETQSHDLVYLPGWPG
jgi:hypothetical protein